MTSLRADLRQAFQDLGERPKRLAHPGLLLARYLQDEYAPPELKEAAQRFRDSRQSLLERTGAALGSACGAYRPAFRRWKSCCDSQPRSAAQYFTAQNRLVIGLGCENVLEVGLTLHHTYGVPVIWGSSLKGLAAHYCHDVWGQGKQGLGFRRPERTGEGEFYRVLFGAGDEGGLVEYQDAWVHPGGIRGDSIQAPRILEDILTPHHQDYYGGRQPLPTDFDNPIPIPFLAVQGTFLIFVTCDSVLPHPERWTNLALQLLTAALADWGIGGKSNSGYGVLVRNSP